MFDFQNLSNEIVIYIFKLRMKIDKASLLGINWNDCAYLKHKTKSLVLIS